MQELQSHMADFEGEERDLAINIISLSFYPSQVNYD